MHTQRKILEESKQSLPLSCDVLIIGTGIAGPVAALEAAKLKMKVTMVEARPESMACDQLVFLNETSVDYLINTIGKDLRLWKGEDKTFRKLVKTPREHVAIKDIQRFLKRRLEKFSNVDTLYHSKLSKLDMEKGTATLVDAKDPSVRPREITFTYLIAADGTSHATANLFIESGQSLEFSTPFKSKNYYFASAYLSVKNSDDSQFNIPKSMLDYVIIDNETRGFVYYNRTSHKKSDQRLLKFYNTTSISEKDYTLFHKDKQAAVTYLQTLSQPFFAELDIAPVKPSRKPEEVGKAKDQLKIQLFKREFYQASFSATEINGHYFLLIGDAYMSPDFFQGIGVNRAILHAQAAAELLSKNTSVLFFNNFSKFNALTQLYQSKHLEQKHTHSTITPASYPSFKFGMYRIEQIAMLDAHLKNLKAEYRTCDDFKKQRELDDDFMVTAEMIEALEMDNIKVFHQTVEGLKKQYCPDNGQPTLRPSQTSLVFFKKIERQLGPVYREIEQREKKSSEIICKEDPTPAVSSCTIL